MSQREVWIFCDCPGCPNEANIDDVDGMNHCPVLHRAENGKLIDKTKYDEDGDPTWRIERSRHQ